MPGYDMIAVSKKDHKTVSALLTVISAILLLCMTVTKICFKADIVVFSMYGAAANDYFYWFICQFCSQLIDSLLVYKTKENVEKCPSQFPGGGAFFPKKWLKTIIWLLKWLPVNFLLSIFDSLRYSIMIQIFMFYINTQYNQRCLISITKNLEWIMYYLVTYQQTHAQIPIYLR